MAPPPLVGSLLLPLALALAPLPLPRGAPLAGAGSPHGYVAALVVPTGIGASVGGFAGDEASTACARCRLSRRYGGRCRLLDKRVVAGFSAPRDASPR